MCVFLNEGISFFFLIFPKWNLEVSNLIRKGWNSVGQAWDTGLHCLRALALSQWKSSPHHSFSPTCLQTRTVRESLFHPFSFHTPHIKSRTPCFCHIIWLHLCTDAVSILKPVQAMRGVLFSVLGHLVALSYNLFRGKKTKHIVDMHGYEEEKK